MEDEVEVVAMLWVLEKEIKENRELPVEKEELQNLLVEFMQVFAKPTRLLPHREVIHKIQIKAREDPINVRPYQYPYIHKNETKKQVDEMLSIGVIQPSNSEDYFAEFRHLLRRGKTYVLENFSAVRSIGEWRVSKSDYMLYFVKQTCVTEEECLEIPLRMSMISHLLKTSLWVRQNRTL